jgi:putative ABC transport system permease protein
MMLGSLIIAALRDHKGRAVLSIAGIALGVALAAAVHTINASAIAEMSHAMRILSGSADLSIEGGRSGFDENIFAAVARHSGVAAASPVLGLEVVPAGQSRPLRLLGIDALRAAYIQPQLVAQTANARDLEILRPDRIFLNAAALHEFNVAPGDNLTLPASGGVGALNPGGLAVLKIAGRIDAGDIGVALGVIDIAGAQSLSGREGVLTRIDLRVRPGIPVEEVRASLAALLPPGVHVTTPAQSADRSANVSRAYRVNLTVLALVSLFTGAFLVFSTCALSVVRRRAELALLRVLGVTRRELALTLVLEGLLVGAVGSALGCALGVMTAQLVLAHFGSDLGSGFFSGLQPGLAWDAPALIGFFLAGTLTGMLGALIPALEAARRPPAFALKAGDDQIAFERLPSARLGFFLLALGLLLALLPSIDDLPWPGFAAIGALLIGTIVLIPRLTRSVLSRFRAPRSVSLLLAWQQVRNMPGYAAAGMTAVVVSFSLVIAMAVMVGSFRQSLDRWLSGVLNADLYVRQRQGPGSAPPLPRDLQRAFIDTPGVKRVDFLRFNSLLIDPAKPPVTLIARPMRGDILESLNVTQRAAIQPPAGMPQVWISEAMLDSYGLRPGTETTLPIGGRAVRVFVGGVWRDYARSYGSVIMDRDVYVQLTGDEAVNDAALWLSDNTAANRTAVREHIRSNAPGGALIEIAEPEEIHRRSLQIFDRSFAVTYALEFAALLVGLAGISSHFAALAFARRHEFGMLRHLGLRTRDIGAMLASEGALIGVLGAAVGLLLGFAMSLILIYVVNRQSFHWSMEVHPPWAWLAALSVLMVLLASFSALASGRVAMTRSAVLAVKDDA